jgi:hypothetical protein
MIFTFHKIILGGQINEHGMCRAYDIYETEETLVHILVVKPDIKGNLGRPMHRPESESNLKIHLQEIGWTDLDLNRLTHNTDKRNAV